MRREDGSAEYERIVVIGLNFDTLALIDLQDAVLGLPLGLLSGWLAAAIAFAAVLSFTWHRSRVHAEMPSQVALNEHTERAWLAMLDAYAEREMEQAKRINSRRSLHAGPQSQDW
jgi:hypothetical protein